MLIGIHEVTKAIYQGQTKANGHYITPQPMLSQMSFGKDFDVVKNSLTPNPAPDEYSFIFREDSFDPTSQIRRGRVYSASTTKPEEWSILPHESQLVKKSQLTGTGQLQQQRLTTFNSYSLRRFLVENNCTKLTILMGLKDSFTKWKLVNIETNYIGEELITLRATSSLGVIPDIDYSHFDAEEKFPIRERVNKLIDVLYTGSVESIVDRAGEACLAILQALIRKTIPTSKGLTLHTALEKMDEIQGLKNRKILKTACELLKFLHSRGKASFQDQHGTRSLNQSDSQAAIECFSIVIYELGIHQNE